MRRTAALVVTILVAGCAGTLKEIVGVPNPPASPAPAGLPIAVVVEHDPWAMLIGADSPSVLLFEDGTLITAVGQSGTTKFSTARLTPAELSSVRATIASPEQFEKLEDEYDLAPGVTDLPTVEIVRYEKPVSKRVQVYGLVTGFVGTPATTRVATEEKADVLPAEFRAAYKVLTTLRPKYSVPWVPRYAEVMIWPYDHSPEQPLEWPPAWPSLDDKRSIRRGDEAYSIILDGSQIQELEQLLARRREKQAISIAGRKWSVVWRPVTPGSRMAEQIEQLGLVPSPNAPN
jgi:hypothetical protein